ncbi:MAG TPA: hypothetical protein VEK57_25585 [Thermoanaerobaculia bacterium]|nr:hypothetical protein [Thermoanaerobaculia bacterium]
MFRYVVLLVASLAVASVASAGCLTCVPQNPQGEGTCEPTTSGWCTYTCCLWEAGTRCYVNENIYPCAPDGLGVVPATYFASKLPLQTEGSALRLRLGKGIPVQRKCAASVMLMARRS